MTLRRHITAWYTVGVLGSQVGIFRQGACPACGGTRLSETARAPKLRGLSLDEVCRMPLARLVEWVAGVPASLPAEMRPMAENICQSFQDVAKRLMDLGLGYLSLDRAASTLSTGERQRMQLARAVRNRTTGVLYVLDEPSIGLHPSNIVGLTGVMHDLVADGNSVLLVDHDTQILSEADWLIEMGPEAGANGARLPEHVRAVEAEGVRQVKLIDAVPIGLNVRSTVATYANVHDELRKIFTRTPDAKRLGFKAGDFSYNTGKLRCPVCDGTGCIDLDVQFLPDVVIPCPECHGSRYGREAYQVRHGDYSLPELMAMDVNTALEACKNMKLVRQRLQVLKDLGLGYLTLEEETPACPAARPSA